MAQLVLTDAEIEINGVVLSDRANSVTLNYEVDSVEVTAFGDGGHKFTGGLQNISVEISFHQDFAAANVEATIFPLVGTTTTVSVKPVSSSPASATNPVYTVTDAFLAAHTPVSASVGELAVTELTFTGGTLVKATS
jgi:hypothetical protein